MCYRPVRMVNKRYKNLDSAECRHLLDYYITIPCGKCYECVQDKMSSWRLRLHFEYESRKELSVANFVTFSFSQVFLTDFSLDDPNVNRHQANLPVRLFKDRFRKALGYSCRYFFISEYGDEKERFHFHGIIFTKEKISHAAWSKLWKYGHVWLGYCNAKTISYITKYVTKAKRSDYPIFVFASPGFGKDGLSRQMIRFYHDNPDEFLIYRHSVNGSFAYKMPAYFRRKIFTDFERNIMFNQFLSNVRNGNVKLDYKGLHFQSQHDLVRFKFNERVNTDNFNNNYRPNYF